MSASDATRAARRNALLATIVPALLLASAYLLIERPRAARALERMERELEDARRQQPEEAALDAAYEQLDHVRADVQAERARRKPEPVPRAAPAPEAIARFRADVTEILQRHGIKVTSEEVARQAGSGRREKGSRTLELSGAYADVHRAMAEIAQQDEHGPVQKLSMRAAREPGAIPTWTLEFQ